MSIDTDLATPQPLYFQHNTREFVTTTAGTNRIELDAEEQMDLFCTTGFRQTPTLTTTNDTLTATCISGTEFKIDDKSVTLSGAACKKLPLHSTRLSKEKCDFGNLVEIGFDVKGKIVSCIIISRKKMQLTQKLISHFCCCLCNITKKKRFISSTYESMSR